MIMNEEELKLFREKLEEEFEKVLENGGDIRSFLYLPYNYLTEKMKTYMDEFLYLQAYEMIEKGEISADGSFVVYQDSLITVKMDTEERKLELLERLTNFFSEREEYEKCSKIQNIIKTIKNGQGKSFTDNARSSL